MAHNKVSTSVKERLGVAANQKQLKIIFYASIGMDLVAVAVIIALVNVVVGIVVAAALLAGEYVVYRVLFRSSSGAGGPQDEKAQLEEQENKRS
jgi:hypothetical protein